MTLSPRVVCFSFFFFFFQAEDGIRDGRVTGVQTCALPIYHGQLQLNAYEPIEGLAVIESQSLLYRGSIALRTKCVDGITVNERTLQRYKIGRASCRERV